MTVIRELELTAREDETGLRLDAWIRARLPSVARAEIREAFADGRIAVAGRAADKGSKVRAGDIARIRDLPEAGDPPVLPEPGAFLRIIHEDADLVALDKPAGQPVQPLRHGETGTLANALAARFPEMAGVGDDPRMPGILHRIDAATSGLVLAARHAAAWESLREQFRRQTVEKTYLAVVEGEVATGGTVESWLAHEPARRGRMYVLPEREAPGGQRPLRAVTAYRPLRHEPARTLLEVTIYTGVTHQIRCQLAHLGHPIVGDAVYGRHPPAAGARLLLHAWRMRLRHPVGGEIRLEAPAPAEFSGASETEATGVPPSRPPGS